MRSHSAFCTFQMHSLIDCRLHGKAIFDANIFDNLMNMKLISSHHFKYFECVVLCFCLPSKKFSCEKYWKNHRANYKTWKLLQYKAADRCQRKNKHEISVWHISEGKETFVFDVWHCSRWHFIGNAGFIKRFVRILAKERRIITLIEMGNRSASLRPPPKPFSFQRTRFRFRTCTQKVHSADIFDFIIDQCTNCVSLSLPQILAMARY